MENYHSICVGITKDEFSRARLPTTLLSAAVEYAVRQFREMGVEPKCLICQPEFVDTYKSILFFSRVFATKDEQPDDMGAGFIMVDITPEQYPDWFRRRVRVP